jgi:hypothetical protein
MATLRCQRLGSMLVALAVASASLLLISAAAEAADVGLFRMKRTWWGGTTSASPADPFTSPDYAPGLQPPDKRPPAEAYVGFETTINGAKGQTVPRFTAPSKFIMDTTYSWSCVPGTCFPGWPESKGYYSYWNLKGSFRPNNSRFGGAASPTTLIFPTTMGNTSALPYNKGNPQTPTTTPCVGGGNTDCGAWARDFGTHMVGDRITFASGRYDHSRAGSIMINPGKNRFGGTMHFFYGPNHLYYQFITINSPLISKAYGPQMDVRQHTDGYGKLVNTYIGDVQYGGPFNVYQMTAYGEQRAETANGDYLVRKIPYFYDLAPFTTGRISASDPFGGTQTYFTLTGYDNRTPDGLSGVVSMVRPRLRHMYQVPLDPNDPIEMYWSDADSWQMDFHFLPEPGSTAMLASGLVVLAGLYRLRRR